MAHVGAGLTSITYSAQASPCTNAGSASDRRHRRASDQRCCCVGRDQGRSSRRTGRVLFRTGIVRNSLYGGLWPSPAFPASSSTVPTPARSRRSIAQCSTGRSRGTRRRRRTGAPTGALAIHPVRRFAQQAGLERAPVGRTPDRTPQHVGLLEPRRYFEIAGLDPRSRRRGWGGVLRRHRRQSAVAGGPLLGTRRHPRRAPPRDRRSRHLPSALAA